MKLSNRLGCVLSIMEKCELLADIGCDHGYICIEAVKNNICKRAYACDTAKGPLSAAEGNVLAAGLSDRIKCILSDGLTAFTDDMQPDCINITGMGGKLIIKILEEALAHGSCMAKAGQLILGAQSDVDMLRHFIIERTRFTIKKELCIFDDGKFYILMDIRPEVTPSETYTDADYELGKYIAAESMDTYMHYLEKQRSKLMLAVERAGAGASDDNAAKLSDLRNRIFFIESRIKEIMQ